MKQNMSLTVVSLLTILLLLFHITDDIIHGMEPGGLDNLVVATLILVVMLCGTVLLAGRRVGYVIMFLGGLLAAVVPYLHMKGAGVGGEFAMTSGAFFFVWTLLALGMCGTFTVLLSVLGLWKSRSGQRGEPR